MADTEKSSHITDHPFMARALRQPAFVTGHDDEAEFEIQGQTWFAANEALCVKCRMAEAAHRETTVKR